jgi:hypothetical protein
VLREPRLHRGTPLEVAERRADQGTIETGAEAQADFHMPYAALEGPLFHGGVRIFRSFAASFARTGSADRNLKRFSS